MDWRGGDSTPVQSSRQIQRLPSLRSLGSLYNAVTSPLRPTNPPRKESDDSSNASDCSHELPLEPIQHQHHPVAQPAQAVASQIHLSTQCQSCGETVAVQVPDWMLNAQARLTDYEQAESAARSQRPRARSDVRDKLVKGAVSGAVAFKNSPVLPFILAVMRAVFAFVLYLDMRFSLHQKLLFVLSAFLEGLIEIEREVGIFRGLGQTVSILWEATVKGTIALAKSEPEVRVSAPAHRVSPSVPQQATLGGYGSPFPSLPQSARSSRDSSPGTVNGSRQRLTRSAHSTTSLPLLLSTSSSSHLLPPVDIHSPTGLASTGVSPPDYQTSVSQTLPSGTSSASSSALSRNPSAASALGGSKAERRRSRNLGSSSSANGGKKANGSSASSGSSSSNGNSHDDSKNQQTWGGRLVGAVTNRIPTGFSHESSY